MIDNTNNGFLKPTKILQNGGPICTIFYGIYVPEDIKNDYKDAKLVYTNKNDCLGVLKKISGARFKVFSTIEEAENFTKLSQATPTKEAQTQSILGEKPSLFRSLKSQDLVKFRKAIERGDKQYFEECIQNNPRYLVSSGDTPSILQEGFRYNALHIACRNNKSILLKHVLALVSGVEFFQRLYPDDSLESSSRRSDFLLDLYLNTPEKGLNETPLHFACKYGALDCVKNLVSYPGCERNRCNKYDETPLKVVCSRSSASTPTKKAISHSISNIIVHQYYVPILRDESNCLAPRIGVPWSPLQEGLVPLTSSSPISPTFKIRGFAGPMSPQKAETFYKSWKKNLNVASPSKTWSPGGTKPLTIIDHEKGLERVARDLASEHSVNWTEFWDFSKSFADLNSEEGLNLLEEHLKKQYRKVVAEMNHENSFDNLTGAQNKLLEITEQSFFDENDSSIDPLELSQLSSTSIGDICRGLEALRLNTSFSPNNSFSKSFTSLSLPFSESLHNHNSLHQSLQSLNDSVLNRSDASFTTFHYNYVVQSAKISSAKVLAFLQEAAQSLELHLGIDYHVTARLKAKLRQETINLREVVVHHLEGRIKTPLDLSFIHVLLSSRVVTPLVEEVPEDGLFLLTKTMEALECSPTLYDDDSFLSDDGGGPCDDDGAELGCVVRCLQKALKLAYELSSSANTLDRIDIKRLGECQCSWHPLGGGAKISLDTTNNNNTSTNKAIKYKGAHSFVKEVLFGDLKVAKQLTFPPEEEDKEDDDQSDAESFVSVASSEDFAEEMKTPEEFIKVYINGCLPSKADLDAQLAIERREIDPQKFPQVAQWLSLLSSHTVEAKQSWSSPFCRPRSLASLQNSRVDMSFTPKSSRSFYSGNLGQSPM